MTHLATLRPTQAEPVWSAVATGRAPMQTGVRSSASYRVLGVTPVISLLPDYCFAQALVRAGFLWEEPHTAEDLTARPLWHILSEQGLAVGVIGWPLTHPAAPVHGYQVSDRFHRMTGRRARHRRHLRDLAAVGADGGASQSAGAAEPGSGRGRVGDRTPALRRLRRGQRSRAGRRRSGSRRAARRLRRVRHAASSPFASPASMRSATTSCAMPTRRPFGDVSEAERRLYGRVLEQYLRLPRHARRPPDQRARTGRRAAGGVGFWHGAAQPEQAAAGTAGRQRGDQRQPRRRARRLPDGLRRARAAGTACRAPRSSISRRPSCTSSACRSAGTWKASPGPNCSAATFTAERPVSYIPSYGR